MGTPFDKPDPVSAVSPRTPTSSDELVWELSEAVAREMESAVGHAVHPPTLAIGEVVRRYVVFSPREAKALRRGGLLP